MTRDRGRAAWSTWVFPLFILGGASLFVFGLTFLADAARAEEGKGLFQVLLNADPEMAWNTLGNLAQVVAAILGIAITVVSIIVELAATRYTPKITELFVRAPVNFAVMGFFLVSCLVCVWVSVVVRADFIPQIGIATTVGLLSLSLLLLIPYFAYVFRFLSPRQIVRRLVLDAGRAIREAMRGRGVERAKDRVMEEVEHIGDIALNAVANRDKAIGMDGIDALADILALYAPYKRDLAESWYALGPALVGNPDFVSMAPEVIDDLQKQRLWLEMKVLRQYQTVFSEALGRQREIDYLIAIHTRALGERALAAGDADVVDLVIKFLNTYLRATINARDVRTGYNLLNEYRLLAAAALRSDDPATAARIVQHFSYYGQLAFASGLPFLLETAAYDLCALNQIALDADVSETFRDQLLDVFLDIDKESELPHEHEASLRGVRKAQVKLATFYLARGREDLARRIYRDMEGEVLHRLRSIREELVAVSSKYFWEVTDRGMNMDYIPPEQRSHLGTFFEWFGARLTVELPAQPGGAPADPAGRADGTVRAAQAAARDNPGKEDR